MPPDSTPNIAPPSLALDGNFRLPRKPADLQKGESYTELPMIMPELA
jgi:hypothetical protein